MLVGPAKRVKPFGAAQGCGLASLTSCGSCSSSVAQEPELCPLQLPSFSSMKRLFPGMPSPGGALCLAGKQSCCPGMDPGTQKLVFDKPWERLESLRKEGEPGPVPRGQPALHTTAGCEQLPLGSAAGAKGQPGTLLLQEDKESGSCWGRGSAASRQGTTGMALSPLPSPQRAHHSHLRPRGTCWLFLRRGTTKGLQAGAPPPLE